MNEIMLKAFEEAKETMNKNYGGPFGAAVIDSNGNVISVASNTVLKDHNPTAHGEVNAILIHNSLPLSNVPICNNLGKYQKSILWL